VILCQTVNVLVNVLLCIDILCQETVVTSLICDMHCQHISCKYCRDVTFGYLAVNFCVHIYISIVKVDSNSLHAVVNSSGFVVLLVHELFKLNVNECDTADSGMC